MKSIRSILLLSCTAALVVVALLLSPAKSQDRVDRDRPYTDEDLKSLPVDLEVLKLRGSRAYGSDRVSDEGIAHLIRCPKLRILHADGLGLTDAALATIGNLPALEELSLDSNEINGFGLEHLKKLGFLRRLSLNFNRLRDNDFITIGSLSGLIRLSALGRPVVDDGALEQCARLTQLEELYLSEFTYLVTDRGIAHLAQLPQLRNVALRDAQGVTDAGVALLVKLPQLQQVSLRGLRSISPSGLQFLDKLPELRRLEISEIKVDEATVRSISRLSKLEHLLLWSVASGPLSLEGMGDLHALRELRTNQELTSSVLRRLSQLRHLESIKDDLTSVSDEDLTHLAQLQKLQFLCLNSDKITVASLPTLARMKSLRELYVTSAVNITPAQWTSLGEVSLPQCQIQQWFAPYTIFHAPKQGSAAPPDMQRLGLLKPVMTLQEVARLWEGKRMIGQGCGGGTDEHGKPRGMFFNDYELQLPNATGPQSMSFHYIQASPSYLVGFSGPGFRYRLKDGKFVIQKE